MVDVEEYGARERRPLPRLLGRADVDGPRGQAQAAADRSHRLAGAARPRPDRGRQRRRRARQHHRDPVHARGGRRTAGATGAVAARAASAADEDTREYNTFQGEAVAEPRQGVSRPQGHTRRWDEPRRPPARRARATRPRRSTAPRARSRCRRSARARSRSRKATPTHRPREQPRRRRRLLSPGKLITVSCIIGLLAAFWLATRQVFFVGVDESRGNVVTLYKGLPYDLPLGIRLYSPVRHSGVTLAEPAGPRTARPSRTTSCAPRTTPRAW